MPASPESNTTCPSLAVARDQRRSSNSRSCSRPHLVRLSHAKGPGANLDPIKTALMSLKLPDPNSPQRGPNPREVGLAPLHWTHETPPVIEEQLATANPKLVVGAVV